MKVLFITNIPAPYRVDFFNELGKWCELTVVYELTHATDRNEHWNTKKNLNFESILLDAPRIKSDTSFSLAIIKYLTKDYDIVVVTMFGSPTQMIAIEYMKLNHIKFFLNSDGGFIDRKENLFKKLLKKHFIKNATAYLSTGKKTTEYLLYYGAKKENVYEYPFSSISNLDILKKPVTEEEKKFYRTKWNIKEEKVVLSVGSFIHRKGYDILVKASMHFQMNMGVYLVGGEETNTYKKIIDEKKLKNIHFMSFKSKEELSEIYKIADVFVLPTRCDVWGLVINEAMAYGLPIITTDMCIAGTELIVSKKNGFIVPVENINILAEKIKCILSDEDSRRKMAKNNLEKIKMYTIEEMVKKHMWIFETHSME